MRYQNEFNERPKKDNIYYDTTCRNTKSITLRYEGSTPRLNLQFPV